MRHIIILGLILCLIVPVFSAYAQNYVQGELIVKFKDGISESRIAEINNHVGTKVKDRILSGRIYILKITSGAPVEDVVKTYEKYPEVKFAGPNYIVKPMK